MILAFFSDCEAIMHGIYYFKVRSLSLSVCRCEHRFRTCMLRMTSNKMRDRCMGQRYERYGTDETDAHTLSRQLLGRCRRNHHSRTERIEKVMQIMFTALNKYIQRRRFNRISCVLFIVSASGDSSASWRRMPTKIDSCLAGKIV